MNDETSIRAGFDNLECKAQTAVQADIDVCDFVEQLNNGKYRCIEGSPISLPVTVKGKIRIDADGKIATGHGVPYRLYPKRVRKLVQENHKFLLAAQDRFLRIVRWTQAVSGPRDLYESSPALYWRRGTAGEHHIVSTPPEERPGLSLGLDGIIWEEDQRETFLKVWNEESTTEPLAHELLREAKQLAESGATRSGLLMAATAVEAGVKQHLALQRPENGWLLENMPSPPVHVLLKEYLPRVHERQELVSNWALLGPLWQRVQKLVTARNSTTHVGKPVKLESLYAHLLTATDVLYLLDALGGQLWARTRTSPDVRLALGWPSPQEMRIRTAISVMEDWEIDR